MRVTNLAMSALLALPLAGCWYGEMRTEMSPAQLAAVDEATWCRAAHYATTSLLATSSANFQNEFNRRYASGQTCGIALRGDAARASATSDALIAAGLQMMATPPPAPPVPRTVDCSPTPGSLGRSVSCW